MGKFRGLSEAAVLRIEHFERRFLNGRQNAGGDSSAATGKRFRLRDGGFHHRRLVYHVAMFFFVGVGDAEQHPAKAGPAVSITWREVGSTIKGLAVGGEESGERPSALSGNRLDGDLIAAVDIGVLIAIALHLE